ncbi:MAG: amino acid permease [Planctomycetaceae bacterium]
MSARRRYGFWTLSAVVVANMIGAGVFTTSGYSLEALQTPTRVLFAWIVGGVIALLGAISYGQLSRAIPESGGEYVYLSRGVHPFFGLIAGWVSLLAGFTGAIALAALTFEKYALPDSIRPEWLPNGIIAVVLIWFGAFLHGSRFRFGAIVQNGVVLLKLLLLLGFFGMALVAWSRGQWHGGPLPHAVPLSWKLLPKFATSLIYISLCYAGFNAAVYLSEEAVSGERTIPRALFFGTLMTVGVYLAMNSVFLWVPQPEQIAGEGEVAAIAAAAIGGDWLEGCVRGTVALALLTSVTSMMLAAPHVYAKMAADGLLPQSLRLTGEVPGRAVLFQAVIASFLAFQTTIIDLLFTLGLTLSLCSAASVACLFAPTLRRQVDSPLPLAAAGLYILTTLAIAGVTAWNNPQCLYSTAAALVVGILLYALTRFMK